MDLETLRKRRKKKLEEESQRRAIRNRRHSMFYMAPATGGLSFDLPLRDAGGGLVDMSLVYGQGATSFARAGATATTILSNGLVSPIIASNGPRSFYYPETANTNYLRNNSMAGVVVGAPGTAPNTWAVSLQSELSREIVGVGVENGIPYVDFRFFGTVTAQRTIGVQFEATNQTKAFNGQTWVGSVYNRLVGGSLADFTQGSLTLQTFDAAGVFISTVAVTNLLGMTGNPLQSQRFQSVGVLPGTPVFVNTSYFFQTAASGVVNFTIRCGAPQLEMAATAGPLILTTNAPLSGNAVYGGYLPETPTDNLEIRSSELDNAAWPKVGGAVSATNVVAPDGTANADIFTEDGSVGVHSFAQTSTIVAGRTITISRWVRPAVGTRYVRLQPSSDAGANGFRCLFNPVLGTIALAGAAFGTGTFIAAGVVQHPFGWFRIWACGTVDPAATAVSETCFLQDQAGTYTASYTGDTLSGVQVWGSMLEAPAVTTIYPSSHVPTGAATVLRGADDMQLPIAGNLDITQGTLSAELGVFYTGNAPANRVAVGIGIGGRPLLFGFGIAPTVFQSFDTTNTCQKTGLSNMSAGMVKRVSSWGAAGQQVTGNGQVPATAAFDGAMGTTAAIRIGSTNGVEQFCGPIRSVKGFLSQKVDAELSELGR